MKLFLRFFFLVLLFSFSIQLFAQTKFGITAGLNVSNIKQVYTDQYEANPTKSKTGLKLGINLDIELSEKFSLQPGIFYSSKGFARKLEELINDVSSLDGYDKVTLNYFELPVNFAYKLNNFQLFAGPYIGFGLGGKHKWDFTFILEQDNSEHSSDGEISYKPVFGSTTLSEHLQNHEVPFNALDYGLNFGAGYQLGKILFNVGYSIGLSNIRVKWDDHPELVPNDQKQLNRNLSISATYFFGK